MKVTQKSSNNKKSSLPPGYNTFSGSKKNQTGNPNGRPPHARAIGFKPAFAVGEFDEAIRQAKVYLPVVTPPGVDMEKVKAAIARREAKRSAKS